jgi:hypothetical protein
MTALTDTRHGRLLHADRQGEFLLLKSWRPE